MDATSPAGGARGCTDAGCGNGFHITYLDPKGEVVDAVMGTVVFDGRRFEFDCAPTRAARHVRQGEVWCVFGKGTGLSLRPLRRPDPLLRIRAQSQNRLLSFEDSIWLQFEKRTPNGPICGPTCYSADVEITLRPTASNLVEAFLE